MDRSFKDAPVAAREDWARYCDECASFRQVSMTWDLWWARYGADYLDGSTENAAGEPGPGEAGQGSSAVLIVPGCAPVSAAAQRTPERTPRPAGQPSLRNYIARTLVDDMVWPIGAHPARVLSTQRAALDAARVALEAASNWVLVFGPQALIDEVSR